MVWSKDVLDYTPRKAFDEELDCLRIPKVITGARVEAFEVVGVLVDFGPFQAEGFQFCSGTLLSLRVLVLGLQLRKELVPNCGDIVDWLEGVDPLSHGSCPFGDKRSLDEV